jgi:hypothetical protein
MAKRSTNAAAALAEARRLEAAAAAAAAEADAAAAEAEAAATDDADQDGAGQDDELIELLPLPEPTTHPVPPSMEAEIGVFDAKDIVKVTPESNAADVPASVVVTVAAEPDYTPPLSERTLAEMAAGRAALIRRGG